MRQPTAYQAFLNHPMLAAFWRREGIVAGGNAGYWDWVRLLGIPVPIPNTTMRLAALPYHDFHHAITGFATDEVGEGEVGAWTLATGGGPVWGHFYDLSALIAGVLRDHRRVYDAWVLGRQCRNLYRFPVTDLIEMNEQQLRDYAGLNDIRPVATQMDRVTFWATVAAGLLMMLMLIPLVVTVLTAIIDPWMPTDYLAPEPVL